jgi:hypothetical protein
MAAAAAVGAGMGYLIGSLDPSLGVGTLAVVGGASAGLADVTGQVLAQLSRPGDLEINLGSTIGAVLGGALGGAGSAALFPVVSSSLIGQGALAALTSGPGALLSASGAHVWDAFKSSPANTKLEGLVCP